MAINVLEFTIDAHPSDAMSSLIPFPGGDPGILEERRACKPKLQSISQDSNRSILCTIRQWLLVLAQLLSLIRPEDQF